ncbi:MAG: ribonuclease III [Bacteroidetes bacterium RIFCSPHIGHO2_02_FULL_44_7]|nr:MAG: ribonuclease III [Bacteroidetes bacterium RIFCSPHIGHO2_02_FULL_44_7]
MLLALFPVFSRKRTPDEEQIFRFIYKCFGYKPKNLEIFRRALTHKSISNNSEEASNERLEFLGDAILDAVVAEYLFNRFPNEDEGYLTKIKSKIVSRRTLSLIGSEMEISKILRYNKGRSIKLETIEGNAFEALIGAVYLDGGYTSAKTSINSHIFRKYVDLNHILEEEIDFKSRLFIWSQKNRLPLRFEVLEERNDGSAWLYLVCVMINDQEYGRGSGSSKKKAEQAAAKETLELVGEL